MPTSFLSIVATWVSGGDLIRILPLRLGPIMLGVLVAVRLALVQGVIVVVCLKKS
jgi:hypothetical protein